MPADEPPAAVCPSCGYPIGLPAGLDCREPDGHGVQRPQKPGKGQWPPYVAEAVTAIEEDDEEEEKPPWQH